MVSNNTPTPTPTKKADPGSKSRSPVNSRWNPSTPQINLLEGLYNQGLRTPTPDQIQQIAAMLSTYGHIEGKNVFYWFQNHKARQRQRQKHDVVMMNSNPAAAAFLNHPHHRFLRHTLPPPLLPSPPSVVCGPSYYADPAASRQHYPKQIRVVPASPGGGFIRAHQVSPDSISRSAAAYPDDEDDHDDDDKETLPLFPLHPTGGLLGRSSPVSVTVDDGVGTEAGRCFDFFSLGAGGGGHLCPTQRQRYSSFGEHIYKITN